MSVAAPVTLLPLAPPSAPSQQVILLPHVLRAPRVISACVDIFHNGSYARKSCLGRRDLICLSFAVPK